MHRQLRQRNSPRFPTMDMSTEDVGKAAAAAGIAPPGTELRGADILIRCLQAEGVKHLWGYPGGAVLYIYDALHRRNTIQHVLVRHEQGAVAADGYARRRRGGCRHRHLRPRGDQRRDRHRHRIHGFDPNGRHHRTGFDCRNRAQLVQECDTVGITRPICKHNFLVREMLSDLPSTMKKAFHIARSDSPSGGGRHTRDVTARHPLGSNTRRPSRCALTTRRPKATPDRSARPCSCCRRRGGLTSIPAVA